MNDNELDTLLKAAPVPERDAGYWSDFPESVTRALPHARSPGSSRPGRPARALLWSAGLATACLVAGFALGLWRGRDSGPSAHELAAMQTCFREFNALFPNQIRTITFDGRGPQLALRETPVPAASTPVFVRVCGAHGCRSFITFSGEQVRANGETLEILVDAGGRVIVAGETSVWSEGRQHPAKPPWRIQAQTMGELL